jgi:GTP-binding protein
MLIDDVTIRVTAGNGGKGAVAFNKNLMELGPAGGSGGRGGSIFARGVSDISALNYFRHKKVITAPNGRDGQGQFRDGPNGDDIVLLVPAGTIIHNLSNQTDVSIDAVGQQVLIARGGNGGKGNFHFRSSTNTSPTQFQPGLPGEQWEIRLELKLIADIGLVGLPNVGKSSLLNELSRAQSKVANYPFTTLEPHLGVYYGLILADIPGLIEGSSSGKGLGIRFLRHIERTKVLFHCISAESPDPKKDYTVIRAELKAYNPELLKKPEYLLLTKSDAVAPAEVAKKLAALKKIEPHAMAISILDDASMQELKKILNTLEKQKMEGRGAPLSPTDPAASA